MPILDGGFEGFCLNFADYAKGRTLLLLLNIPV